MHMPAHTEAPISDDELMEDLDIIDDEDDIAIEDDCVEGPVDFNEGDKTSTFEDFADEINRDKKQSRKWPMIIGAIVALIVVGAIVFWAVSATTPKMLSYTGDAAHAVSFEQIAFEKNSLGYVPAGNATIKKLNDELAAYQADPRRSYAVNAALKNTWKSEPVDHKVVYLTFDDGPSSMTPRVLEILARYNAKATFFVTCQYPDSLYLIKEAYDQGHTIGMHTASHNYSQLYASDEAYFADLDQIAQIVKDQIGYVPCFVRLPGGASNTISANYSKGIVSRVTTELVNRGYQFYDWSASSGDGGTVNRDQAYANAIRGDGQDAVVILCHDTPAKGSTADALPAIIEFYQSRGYTFKGLDRNTPITHHAIAN